MVQLERDLERQCANRDAVGWVVEMGDHRAGCAHPLEKSAPGFSLRKYSEFPYIEPGGMDKSAKPQEQHVNIDIDMGVPR